MKNFFVIKQSILIFAKQFIRKLVKKYGRGMIIAVSALLLVVITFTSIGLVKAYTEDGYESAVTFDQNQPLPVVLIDRKTEIKPGLANVDIDKLNNEHDPEAIKAYIQQLGDEYGIDWKLVYAIGYHESGNFGSSLAARNNNFFGRKAHSGGYASWETAQEGIRNQFEYLKTRYFDRGMDTPAKINPVYAEDMSWQYAIQSVISSL